MDIMLVHNPAQIVLLSFRFFARRDEFLWGRLETCGGLAIRLPPLAAPLRAWENRTPFAACRYAGQDGILRAGWQPALWGHSHASECGLPTRRSLPSCPTRSQPVCTPLVLAHRWGS